MGINQATTLQTIVNIPTYPVHICYNDRIMMIGSCFSENVGSRLLDQKYQVMVNPFGVMYNPLSVKKNLDIIMHKKHLKKEDLHYANHLWFSYDFHTSFSQPSEKEILASINKTIDAAHDHLYSSKVLFLTFGTARVYTLKETGQVVANCHKQPGRLFHHQLLHVEDIVAAYNELMKDIQNQFPDLHIVFTVSPVRHWKDGATGNQRSKSTLILALHQVLENHDNCHYFPAYEIFMDELRDYRFYADDMLHPSSTGKHYIWQRFAENLLAAEEQDLREKIDKINRAFQHRPYFPDSDEYKAFAHKTLKEIESLQHAHPHLNFEEEKLYFHSILKGSIK